MNLQSSPNKVSFNFAMSLKNPQNVQQTVLSLVEVGAITHDQRSKEKCLGGYIE